jgi:hypothetical protein
MFIREKKLKKIGDLWNKAARVVAQNLHPAAIESRSDGPRLKAAGRPLAGAFLNKAVKAVELRDGINEFEATKRVLYHVLTSDNPRETIAGYNALIGVPLVI